MAASRMQLKVPMRLISITRRYWSRLCADAYSPSRPMVRVAQPMPAQFTSDFSGAISTAASTAVITCSGLVTSVCTNRPPISLARGTPLSSWRSATTTRTPRSASRREVARPSPDAPPVTIADVPFRSISLRLLVGVWVPARG